MSPKAKQTKRKARVNAYNDLLSQETERAREEREIYIAPGPRLGDVVIRTRRCHQGLRRQSCCTTTSASTCRRAPSWASSAPTAQARPRCSE